VDVPAIAIEDLGKGAPGEESSVVRDRVLRARSIQRERQGETNARLEGVDLERQCRADEGARKLLDKAATQLALSARSYFRVLRVSRTIADLAGVATLSDAHVAEALRYRGARSV